MDDYIISDSNLKVLQTIPEMMKNKHYKKQLRLLVLEYLNGKK